MRLDVWHGDMRAHTGRHARICQAVADIAADTRADAGLGSTGCRSGLDNGRFAGDGSATCRRIRTCARLRTALDIARIEIGRRRLAAIAGMVAGEIAARGVLSGCGRLRVGRFRDTLVRLPGLDLRAGRDLDRLVGGGGLGLEAALVAAQRAVVDGTHGIRGFLRAARRLGRGLAEADFAGRRSRLRILGKRGQFVGLNFTRAVRHDTLRILQMAFISDTY